MQNKVTSLSPNGGNVSLGTYRKENALDRQWSLIDLKTGDEILIIRTYQPGSVVYACVWTRGALGHSNGKGKAGGYGYCRTSAAIQEALESAGIQLQTPIDGRGFQAIEGAIDAIARAAGIRSRYAIIKAHG